MWALTAGSMEATLILVTGMLAAGAAILVMVNKIDFRRPSLKERARLERDIVRAEDEIDEAVKMAYIAMVLRMSEKDDDEP